MNRLFLFALIVAFVTGSAACGMLPNRAAAGEQAVPGGGTGSPTPTAGPSSLIGIRIAIDPGHGGHDFGALGKVTGVPESELNLQVANLLAQLFRGAGAEVLLTRESAEVDYSGQAQTDKLKDMMNRARDVRDFRPDALVSIHMNQFTEPSVRGAEAFWQEGSKTGQELAQQIQDELNSKINTAKLRKSHPGDFYILQVGEMPSVLVECGYLSNPEEERLLQDPEHQRQLAECVFQGVSRYLVDRGQ